MAGMSSVGRILGPRSNRQFLPAIASIADVPIAQARIAGAKNWVDAASGNDQNVHREERKTQSTEQKSKARDALKARAPGAGYRRES